MSDQNQFLLYTAPDGAVKVDVFFKGETVWLTQKALAELFGVKRPAITKHLGNIFATGELAEDSVCSILEHAARDGKTYSAKYYNLDAIIAVGYRVNSYQATQFRIWATRTLRELIIKGFVLDDERLKRGKQVLGKDYFDELLERIREIRASERRFYQKITDIYALSVDYRADAPLTQEFFATGCRLHLGLRPGDQTAGRNSAGGAKDPEKEIRVRNKTTASSLCNPATLLLLLLTRLPMLRAAELPLAFADSKPQRYEFSARASVIDARARPHPEIDFVFEKDGKPADVENASVDTRVPPKGKLVIWLMGHSAPLFERVNGYGLHAIRVHYANGWFGRFGTNPPPADDKFLGKIRLEAATGEDFSDVVNIPQPDGMMERALQFVKWLAKENPPGRWEYFLTDDGRALRWERVIVAGSSHGSTTAARFAKHQHVDRVVMFCGPRDQFETWQALPSATPANRFFGFSHVLDDGWKGDHYCRSWELLGLREFGPVVNVDKSSPPYGNTRRLITDADVKNDAKRAHGSVVPGGSAVKDANGKFLHEDVWRYLFTNPVDEVGKPAPHDTDCAMDLRSKVTK